MNKPTIAILSAMIAGPAAAQDVEYVFYGAHPSYWRDGWEVELVRIDLDVPIDPNDPSEGGTFTVVGECGLGVESLTSLTWIGDRLIGVSSGRVAEVDLLEGVATPVFGDWGGPVQTSFGWGDTAYDPVSDVLYVTGDYDSRLAVYRFDLDTWMPDLIILLDARVIAFTDIGPEQRRGLYFSAAGSDGLHFFDVADFSVQRLGNTNELWRCGSFEWNPVTAELWGITEDGGVYYTINVETGETTTRGWINDGFLSVALVPRPDPAPLSCTRMDSDGDEDVDLEDFAEFMVCFGLVR